jgi:type II secretory pathway pseudopilin PulG
MHIGLLTPSFASRRTHGRGLTLTEVLIAVTITLVLMAVLVNAFRDISGQISESRAIIQLAGQLRSGAEQLRDDLRGVTLPVRPWVNPAEGQGYFEQAEYDIAVDNPDFLIQPDNIIGDVDDVLMFTCRSTGAPFRGRIRLANGTLMTIESPLAEIVIWTRLLDENGNGTLDRNLGEFITVHRRVLLIRPDLNDDIAVFPTIGQIAGNNNLLAWYQNNDVSVHVSETGLVANSLGDLSKREYRFAHTVATDANFLAGNITDIDASLFPYPVNRNWLNALTLQGNFAGEDVLLADVVTFDVKLFDPNAPVYDDEVFQAGGFAKAAIVPGDPAFEALLLADAQDGAVDAMIDLGTYVDAGYMINAATTAGAPVLLGASYFSGYPQPKSQMGLNAITLPAFSRLGYDTWPNHYESDGLNQDGAFSVYGGNHFDVDINGQPTTGLIDEGSNGFDEPHDGRDFSGNPDALFAQQINGADDAAERETSPPYPVPLRGIEIRIRLVEPTSQQVRQTSVAVDFEN